MIDGEVMMEKLQEYFGIQVREEKFKATKGLPLYLVSGRNLQEIEMEGKRFLLVHILEGEKYGVAALKKQMKKYSEATKLEVAFSFSTMTRVQRSALLKANIPFISLPDQVYLPFLGMVFSNQFRKKKLVKTDKMMPVTQQVFLYLFYHTANTEITKSLIADALGVTRTSITRASEQLLQMKLITQERRGKEIYIHCNQKGREFFEQASPFLINPVQKEIYVNDDKIPHDLLKAGETALGEQTMLNPPKIPEYAIYKGSEWVAELEEVEEQWEWNGTVAKLQLWKYDPKVFSKDEYVDPISLICSLKDNTDERVEMQIEELKEELKW